MRLTAMIFFGFFMAFPAAAQSGADRGVSVVQDRLEITVPEAYELANVLIFMTDWAQENPRNHFADTEYASAVRAWFEPYRDHQVFRELAQIDFEDFSNFIGMREGAYPFSFDQDGELKKTDRYPYWWSAGSVPWHFETQLETIEDFARISRFREFYRWQRPFYTEQAAEMFRMVDLERVNSWLQTHFPARYDTLTVVISPLGRGRHTASSKERPDGGDLRIAVSGPYLADLPSAAGGDLSLTRQAFTEIDHGYVDPVSDQHEEAIAAVFGKAGVWRKNASSFYGKPQATFNEHMTWAAFLLYVRDHYPPERYAAARAETIDYMQDRRGFIAFGEFYDALERLYHERSNGVTLTDLYPAIIAWAANRQEKAPVN